MDHFPWIAYPIPLMFHLIQKLHLQQDLGVQSGRVGEARDNHGPTIGVGKVQTLTDLHTEIQ